MVEHADAYHLDTENLFIVGDSAGGQMAMQCLATLTNLAFRQLFRYERLNVTVRAAAINCGASFMQLPGAISGAIEAYFTRDAIHSSDERLNTESSLTPEMPPLFLMTANNNFIRDQTVRLDGYLLAKGISHEFHSYGTPDDPRPHVFHCNMKDPPARQCNQDELDFFRRYLKQ